MEYDCETPDDLICEDSWSVFRFLWLLASVVVWSGVGLFFAAEYNHWQHSKNPVVIYEQVESQTSCSGILEIPIAPNTETRRDM